MSRSAVLGSRKLIAGVLLVLFDAAPAAGLEPDRSISQLHHTRWTTSEGAPSVPRSLIQVRDGHLWMTSADGVFRFDGLRFERMDSEVDLNRYGTPLPLLATRGGDIWTWYREGVFAVYRDGRFHLVNAPGAGDGPVTRLVETADGAIWAQRGNFGRPLLRYYRGRWTTVDPSEGYGPGFLGSTIATQDGALWVSYIGRILRRGPGQTRFEQILAESQVMFRLLTDHAGRVWVLDPRGLRLLSGAGGNQAGFPSSERRFAIDVEGGGFPLFDRDGSFWVASASQGLIRARLPAAPATNLRIDRFTATEGLTSNAGTAILEDREGSIWVVTSRGLNRFRAASVVTEPLLTHPATYGDILFAASDGSVFVAESSTVYRIAPGGDPQPFLVDTSEPEAICEGAGGTLWFVFVDQVLAVDRRGARRQFDRPAADGGIYDCVVDRRDRLWLSAAGSGLFMRDEAGWKSFPGPPPGPDTFYPTSMAVDRGGAVWLYWNQRTLARMDETGPVTFSLAAFPDLIAMEHLYPGERGPIVSGRGGIGQWRGDKMLLATGTRMSAFRQLNGLVQTPQGETWGMGPAGIVRVMTADLERAFHEPSFAPPVKVLNFLDGLTEPSNRQSWRSIVRGGDGRLWAATVGGTVWIDPARLPVNRHAPHVAITGLVVDGVRHRDPKAMTLAAGTANLSLRFAAPSLAFPDRVTVRYMLEGYDSDWTEAGMRREAFYTNLDPGTYRFRVIAANEDGVWNRDGATLEFTIPPTFVQSVWFKLLIALAVLVLAGFAYRFRMRQVTARMQSRFDIRIAERERIARELHDTLLQGIQGLMLRFQAAANRVSAPDVRETLDDALERADAVLVEGRARVRDLRRTSETGELAQRLAGLAGALIGEAPPSVDLSVKGEPRELHPLVLEEALRIAEEAIRNAANHAGATRLDIEIVYGGDAFALRLRDDGRGIPQAVLDDGKRDGHFGLVGMCERAQQIGGELGITSSDGGGTEIALLVPPRAAYSGWRFRLRDFLRIGRLRPSAR